MASKRNSEALADEFQPKLHTMLKEKEQFLGDFHPELSVRERRKLTRANMYKASNNKCLHDREGCLIEDGSDFCDCLNPHCPGCHFPCPKCASPKCSIDCRKNRKWTPDAIELEGTNIVNTLEQAKKVRLRDLSMSKSHL